MSGVCAQNLLIVLVRDYACRIGTRLIMSIYNASKNNTKQKHIHTITEIYHCIFKLHNTQITASRKHYGQTVRSREQEIHTNLISALLETALVGSNCCIFANEVYFTFKSKRKVALALSPKGGQARAGKLSLSKGKTKGDGKKNEKCGSAFLKKEENPIGGG